MYSRISAAITTSFVRIKSTGFVCCEYCTDLDGVNGAEDTAMMCREDCGRTQGGASVVLDGYCGSFG